MSDLDLSAWNRCRPSGSACSSRRTALELLPTDNHYCSSCPYLKYGSTNLEEGCPGDPSASMNKPINQDDAPFGAVYKQGSSEAAPVAKQEAMI